MKEVKFPFPDRMVSRQELARDRMYEKIPEEVKVQICDRAWQTGCEAAGRILCEVRAEENGLARGAIYRLAARNGLRIEHLEKDQVTGGQRIFAEYSCKERLICLYSRSIERFAMENQMAPAEAEELILAHEYFHFLECTSLGEISRQYIVPHIQIGPFKFGRSGVRALSEIAANGFARTYWEANRNKCLEE